ncbi:MAG: DUF5320 domain-containing protein [Kiritimatiellae bacterium]|nr:DUF5320 domain-containing protein [Kiritimatiellia bacterium]NLD89831.1 DUF5320 domain-containing protein [Lentisphaerota bacterium]HOU20864.1 DUF5320 domain-containing protein [Kiritimatiellia bacterium]HPC19960.1 DUF5320 domain-containing protein [Kiritimatiellia bacterium]
MPRGDRTGPMGAGPMTGRAAGYCTGTAAPGFASYGFGGGRGRGMGWGGGGGRGFGRGFGRGWIAPVAGAVAPTGPQELAVLKQQAQQLQADMELIQSRIQELETKPEKS